MKRFSYISFPNDFSDEHCVKIGIDWYMYRANFKVIDATNKYRAKVGFPTRSGPYYEELTIKFILLSRVYIFEIKLREVKREEA